MMYVTRGIHFYLCERTTKSQAGACTVSFAEGYAHDIAVPHAMQLHVRFTTEGNCMPS